MQLLISEWILEFLLLQPIEDYLANSLLRALPLRQPPPPRLRRILLLRRLASDLSRCSFSVHTLHTLELTHALTPSSHPQLLCSAYAAVAVHCAAEPLHPNSADTEDAVDFFDAVNRIFNCRVADLERSEAAGLVSEELRMARRDMEAAVVDRRIRREVAARDTKAAAVAAIRSFLKFELEKIGPPFIERVQRVIEGEGIGPETFVKFRNQIMNDLQLQSSVPEDGSEDEGAYREDVIHSGNLVRSESRCRMKELLDPLPSSELSKLRKELMNPLIEACSTRSLGNLKDSEGVGSIMKHDAARFSVCEGIDDFFRLDLDSTATMQPKIKRQGMNNEMTVNNFKIIDVHGGCHDNINGQDTDCVSVRRRPCQTDMNPTAQNELDDESIESASVSSLNLREKLNPPNIKRMVNVKLKFQRRWRFTRRRKTRKWSLLEEETLRKAVERHGNGKWKFIKHCHPRIFEGRTKVDLKDKWRNMKRY